MTSRFGVKGDLNVASEITLNGSGILGTINYLQTELDKINAKITRMQNANASMNTLGNAASI